MKVYVISGIKANCFYTAIREARNECESPRTSLILAVDHIHDQGDNHALLGRVADRDQERHGDEGIIGDALCAVLPTEQSILLHKPQEQCCRNPLVAVHEAVVLDQEVEQMSRFFLEARIDILAVTRTGR